MSRETPPKKRLLSISVNKPEEKEKNTELPRTPQCSADPGGRTGLGQFPENRVNPIGADFLGWE